MAASGRLAAYTVSLQIGCGISETHRGSRRLIVEVPNYAPDFHFCDKSHEEIGFRATGEPNSQKGQALAARDGLLAVDPETNGPLRVRGNLQIISGSGRNVTTLQSTRLC